MKLKALMEERNMSASELAEALGVSQRRLQSWMYGEREPDIAHLIALAEALKCTIDALVGRQKEGDPDGSGRSRESTVRSFPDSPGSGGVPGS